MSDEWEAMNRNQRIAALKNSFAQVIIDTLEGELLQHVKTCGDYAVIGRIIRAAMPQIDAVALPLLANCSSALVSLLPEQTTLLELFHVATRLEPEGPGRRRAEDSDDICF